jgi:xanthine dehydrogenase accessory factor
VLTVDRVLDVLAQLKARAEPCAVATVVRTEDATSAKAGAKALVREDGTLEGWIGGGCVQAAVRKAGLRTLADGEARLIRVAPKARLDAQGLAPGGSAGGVEHHPSHCPSGGTVDVFVEPILPASRLVVVGQSAVATALRDLAARLGYVIGDLPAADERGYVVVATQGHGDRAALRAALLSPATYVAFVGSRKKAAILRGALAGDGVPEERLAALRAPAGLAIGAIGPEEIALAVLAEIIQVRRQPVRATAAALFG